MYPRSDLVSTLESVRQLTEREPERALAWTHLAQLYLENQAYALSDARTPIEKSISAAYRALNVDPSCTHARCILANALLVKGELQAATHELHKLLPMLGDSLAYREIVGSLLALCGDWDVGVPLMRDALERNPCCSPVMNQALWAFHMQRSDYEAAHRTALAHLDSSGFWRELMLACSLKQLERLDDAHAALSELLRSRPDFPHRAAELIGYYIKSSSLRGRIESSLRLLGMRTPTC
jgi:tetratricopeptide (TPR) repeat protein